MSDSTTLVDNVVLMTTASNCFCDGGNATGITMINLAPNSGTITIGSGTGITASTEASPINIYYMSQVAQMVYTRNEINAAGGTGPFTIQQLGWFIGGIPALAMPNYTIKIKHVTATDVSSPLGTTGWTVVRTITSYLPTTLNVYDLITLTTPFSWNGVDNLGIEICWDSIGTFSPSGQVQFTTSANGYRFTVQDSINLCGTIPGSTSSNKPNIRIVYG